MAKAEVPVIVAELEFLNQMATLPLTTVYSVTTTGPFRINIGGSINTPSSQLSFIVKWTDDFGVEQTFVVGINNTGSLNFPQSLNFRAVTGTAITVQGNAFSATLIYDLDIVLEQF